MQSHGFTDAASQAASSSSLFSPSMTSKGSRKDEDDDGSGCQYQDRPCLNCGRYGIMHGLMVTTSDNLTFCSPECGWSYWLRPSADRQATAARKAAEAAAAQRAAPPFAGRAARRNGGVESSRRSSRHASTSNSEAAGPSTSSRQSGGNAAASNRVAYTSRRNGSSTTSGNDASTAKKPPRLPRKQRVESKNDKEWEYSNALYEFSRMYAYE